jgi:hypothetical protein
VSLRPLGGELVKTQPHARDAAGARSIGLANPHHRSQAGHQGSSIRQGKVEAQKRTDREWLLGADKDAACAYIGTVARNKLIQTRTLEFDPECDRIAFWA